MLDDLARQGAQRMLKEALEVEVQEFVARHEHVVDEEGAGVKQRAESSHFEVRADCFRD